MRAAYQQTLADGTVRCGLCPHRCTLAEGQAGICRVRVVRGGVLETTVHGRADALQIDPIEKKPLFHFLPGSRTVSLATVGCNLRCSFCQNHALSQTGQGRGGGRVEDAQIVALAQAEGARSVSYTYSEPTVFYEYVRDVAGAAKAAGLANVIVTNGFINPRPLAGWLPLIDAANVDLKFPDDARYRQHTGGRLPPVLATIAALHDAGRWVEVTTLVIPGLNDAPQDLSACARAVAAVSPDIPWHVSRFHPAFRMRDRPATPLDTLTLARRLGGEAGLRHVYVGNWWGDEGESTFCPTCGARVLARVGYLTRTEGLADGRCAACGEPIAGVWS